MTRPKPILLAVFLAGSLALFTSCDSGGSGGGGGDAANRVGPDLQGKWAGTFAIQGVPGSTQEITARVTHKKDTIVIKTSKDMEGSKLTGNIDEGGDMFLTDNFDGETWTTRFGPATETSIVVVDFRRDISDTAASIIRLNR